MKKFAYIVGDRAYWVFEAEELPPYPNPQDFVDVTGREVLEGDLYDWETDEFTRPEPPTPEPIPEPEDSTALEKLIKEMKSKLTEDNIALFETIVAMFEQSVLDAATSLEVNTATLESMVVVSEDVSQILPTVSGEVAGVRSDIQELKELIVALQPSK